MQVVFEGDGDLLRATGVIAVRNKKDVIIDGVRRDVVVAAGALTFLCNPRSNSHRWVGTFQTPQVLELSGIGNPSILSQFGVKSVIDLPGVGENLRAFSLTNIAAIGLYPRRGSRWCLHDCRSRDLG